MRSILSARIAVCQCRPPVGNNIRSRFAFKKKTRENLSMQRSISSMYICIYTNSSIKKNLIYNIYLKFFVLFDDDYYHGPNYTLHRRTEAARSPGTRGRWGCYTNQTSFVN